MKDVKKCNYSEMERPNTNSHNLLSSVPTRSGDRYDDPQIFYSENWRSVNTDCRTRQAMIATCF